MNDKTWVVIPTYWGQNGTQEHPSDTGVFDHPTEVDGHETLERTVKNIVSFQDDFKVLILLAVTHKEYKKAAKVRVEKILTKYKDQKEIYLVCNDDLDEFNDKFEESPLNFRTYGAIRNVQLAIPYIMGADIVIAIDDDEIISDKQYFKNISQLMQNDNIDLLSGVYLNEKESYLLPKINSTDANPFIQKLNLINAVVTNAMSNPIQPHRTHIGFGGNMIFSRKIMENVCFDEYIPRGEDFDYILNALAADYSVYFDKNIPITHLPVSKPSKPGEIKVTSDIKRHIYTYYKKQSLQMNVKQDIYPGDFLKDIEDLKKYSIIAYKEESKKSLQESTYEVNKIIEEVLENKDIYTKQKLSWKEFIEIFQKNQLLLNFSIKWAKCIKLT
jgi:hypothetical protein